MTYISIILILSAAYVLYRIFAGLALCIRDRQARRKAHQRRRKAMREWHLRRREYDFILTLTKQSDITPQEKQGTKQTVTYKGYFTNLKILRVRKIGSHSVGYYIYPPKQLELLLQYYKDMPDIEAIILDCPPELITLLNKLEEKE